MKVLVAVVLFVAAVQAKSVSNLFDLPFIHRYAPLNPSHTAEEWDAIYAAAENFTTEDTTGLVPGAEPQPEDAGKVVIDPAERIIGGSAASPGQFPWHALLLIGGKALCGGSLISREWVLTAAHCIHGAESFHVILGSTSRIETQAGSVTQNARQGVTHQSYNDETYANDVALLKLATAVKLSNFINVVRLPESGQVHNTFAGAFATISGFGRTDGYEGVDSGNLLYINTNIITNSVCARTFGSRVLASNICSLAGGEKNTCVGDGGGALVSVGVQVGIASFRAENCILGTPTVYTRVTSFLGWIAYNSGIAI